MFGSQQRYKLCLKRSELLSDDADKNARNEINAMQYGFKRDILY